MFQRVQRPDQNAYVRQQQQENEAKQKKQKTKANPDLLKYKPNLGVPESGITQKKEAKENPVSKSNRSPSKDKMPEDVQSKMEQSFGTSFNDVNIHTNDKSATDLGALAYTQGNNVHFAPGQYNPESKQGQELLGHELTHVVQQKQGRVKSPNIGDMQSTVVRKSEKQLKKEEQRKETFGMVHKSLGEQIQLKMKYNPEGYKSEIARNSFNNYTKTQLKQLKRDKQNTRLFTSKKSNFERALVQRKIRYGSEDYVQLAAKFFPDFDATVNLPEVNNSPTLENEADVMGKRAAESKSVEVSGKGSGVQKQEEPESNAIPQETPSEIIQKAYEAYSAGDIGMPEFARRIIPYASTNSSDILALFSKLPSTETDTFAYALSANTKSTNLLFFSNELLQTISSRIDTVLTKNRDENIAEKSKVDQVLEVKATPKGRLYVLVNQPSLTQEDVATAKELIGQLSESERPGYLKKLLPLEAATDLSATKSTFDNTLSAYVGNNQTNNVDDVKKVANGLVANGYTVNDVSINEGTCDATMIAAIKDFEKDILGRKGNKIVGYLDPGCWTGDHDVMFGNSPGTFNSSLKTWKRGESYNAATGLTNYTINDDNFIDRSTYDTHIDQIAEDKGVEKDSEDGKAIATAARAATDDAYFDELTKNVTSELVLSYETVESHQVNPILKHRLGRFHKYLSAVGLFSGNMKGGACRSAKTAHRWAVPHVVIDGMRPASSKESVENNVTNVFNGETVAGGIKDASNNVKDTDGNIWAKPEHFNIDDDGKATSIKDDDWEDHLIILSGRNTWGVYIAEGYKRGDTKRFPLGLQASPGRSNHITGDAIDINKNGFLNMNDSKIDIIALYFGLSRPVSGEQWHFEAVNVGLSDNEIEQIDNSTRNSVT